MANRQPFQLTNQATPATTAVIPVQIADGSTEVEKVTIANLKTAFALTKADVGLSNVDNTADTSKPISTLTQVALDTKATGPASATDNAVARFDSTTGKLIQNSTVSIADLGKMTFPGTVTPGGTTGNQTINLPSGTVNIAAAGTTVTVTNSLVTASSIVLAVVRTNDATAIIKNVVPGSGSFVITMDAAVTAETSIGFVVFN